MYSEGEELEKFKKDSALTYFMQQSFLPTLHPVLEIIYDFLISIFCTSRHYISLFRAQTSKGVSLPPL